LKVRSRFLGSLLSYMFCGMIIICHRQPPLIQLVMYRISREIIHLFSLLCFTLAFLSLGFNSIDLLEYFSYLLQVIFDEPCRKHRWRQPVRCGKRTPKRLFWWCRERSRPFPTIWIIACTWSGIIMNTSIFK